MKRHELETLLSRHLYILDKQKRKTRFKPNVIQRHLAAHLTGRDLILKARQVGISTFLQTRLSLKAWTGSASTLTLSYDDDGTQMLRRMSEFFYTSLPERFEHDDLFYTKPRRKYASAKLVTYPDTRAEMMTATAGSKLKGRGGTFTHIHASEAAFWTDAERTLSAFLEAGDPEVALESTPNGAQGYFYELCMEALDGNSNWTLHFYPWWWEPTYRLPLENDEARDDFMRTYTPEETDLIERVARESNGRFLLTPEQIKWRRGKQRDLKHLFGQEYPEDPKECFLLSGMGYFGTLPNVFTAPLHVEPDVAHKYVAGLDWGQANDYTVLFIWDVTTKQMVSLLRVNKLAWAEMRRRVAAECRRWNVRLICAERNSASSNIEDLRSEFDGDWRKPTITDFVTTNPSKALALSDLYEALNTDGWTLQNVPEVRREFMAFQAKQTGNGWKYGAPQGEHDDIVMAAAFATYAALHQFADGAGDIPEVLTAHFLGDM